MVINTNEFIARIAKNGEISKSDCKYVLRILANTICEILQEGNTIKWRGIMEIGVKYRKGGAALHPITGEKIQYPGRHIPYCTLGETLANAITDGEGDAYRDC